MMSPLCAPQAENGDPDRERTLHSSIRYLFSDAHLVSSARIFERCRLFNKKMIGRKMNSTKKMPTNCSTGHLRSKHPAVEVRRVSAWNSLAGAQHTPDFADVSRLIHSIDEIGAHALRSGALQFVQLRT